MKILEGDELEIMHLGRKLKCRALNSTGKEDRGVLTELFELNGERTVLYVEFNPFVNKPEDERAVGGRPGGSAVLDSMASPVLLGIIGDTHIGARQQNGEADDRGGEPMLDAPVLDK